MREGESTAIQRLRGQSDQRCFVPWATTLPDPNDMVHNRNSHGGVIIMAMTKSWPGANSMSFCHVLVSNLTTVQEACRAREGVGARRPTSGAVTRCRALHIVLHTARAFHRIASESARVLNRPRLRESPWNNSGGPFCWHHRRTPGVGTTEVVMVSGASGIGAFWN